jgi:hypothetical protein
MREIENSEDKKIRITEFEEEYNEKLSQYFLSG